MDIPVVVALIAALGGLTVSIISTITARRNARDLKSFSTDLDQQSAERSARRDYEYEARKGLYHRVEPLRFRMLLAADSGYDRVASLARRMQHELTLVDFSLDPRVRLWFVLARMLPQTFAADFDLARTEPRLPYFPNTPERDVGDQPSTKLRQGVYLNLIEDAADAMVAEADEGAGLVTFGDFARAFGSRDRSTPITPVADLLVGFHPALRPVTWRIFITQAHLHHAMMSLRSVTDPENLDWRRLLTIPWNERNAFDWRNEHERAGIVPDEDVLAGPFTAAEDYLVSQLDKTTALMR